MSLRMPRVTWPVNRGSKWPHRPIWNSRGHIAYSLYKSMRLRWWLRGVYRRKLYTGALLPKMGQKLTVLGGKGNCECQSSDPPRKSNYTETHHPVQKVRRYSQKCVLQSWARKAIKKERKKERKKDPYLNIIFHPFTGPALRGRLLPFLACGVPPPT